MIEGENGDWNRLFDALPSSVFWKSGFLQLFSQCAKHDVSGRILWPESLDAKIYSAALWTFQLSSSSSGDGRHGRNNGSRQSQHLQVITSSVRSIGSPATKIAPRVLDTAHRARSIAKFLVFRSLNYTATTTSETSTVKDDDGSNNNNISSISGNREKLFEFLEHCYHPDSPGSDL